MLDLGPGKMKYNTNKPRSGNKIPIRNPTGLESGPLLFGAPILYGFCDGFCSIMFEYAECYFYLRNYFFIAASISSTVMGIPLNKSLLPFLVSQKLFSMRMPMCSSSI